MRKIALIFGCIAALSTAAAVSAHADCKGEIKEVRDDIDQNKDNYTAEAKAEARKHLVKADVPSVKPAECERQVAKAKQALRKGKK